MNKKIFAMKKEKILTVIFLLGFVIFGFAQSDYAKEYYKKGKAYYDDNEYEDAIEQFINALNESENYEDALYYLGHSYYYNSQYEKAIETYARLDKLNPDYWAYFYYNWGRANMKMNNMEKAAKNFNDFLEKYPKDPDRIKFHHWGKYYRYYCEQRKSLINKENTMKDPVNLGEVVNSISDEYSPQVDPVGNKLYFTSTRKSKFSQEDGSADHDWGEDVYVVERDGDGWGIPQLLPEPINSSNNEGTATFSGDGQAMIYVKCGADDGIGSCDLYISELEGDTWSEPKNMGNIVNTEKWESQPSISADGTTIIFTSTREGGYGDNDLYMVRKNRFGDWGVPQNLGPIINTPYNEKSPHIAPDGKTLYFGSYGHPGYGGADLFKSTFENGTWSEPVNLGKPLNSEGNDNYFSISASGEFAYFGSTRAGGIGDEGLYDLYKIEIPEELRPQPTVVVSGIVTDAKENNPLSAWVLVEDLNSGELIATNKSNSKTGEYLVVLPAGRNYAVTANSKGYFFYSQNFKVTKESNYQELKKDIVLKPIEKGTKVVLNNVFFETGKSDLSDESRVELNKAVELMETNPSMVIEVGGHTDNVGDDDFNMKLSHERAKSVRQYLVNAGIASERIQAKGYGETTPVADNETEEGRAANRRTEFIILEF